MLGDLGIERATAGATPFVTHALGEANRPDVIGSTKSDGHCSLQIADEIPGPAAQLTHQ